MDAGQVKFAVLADGMERVTQQARELEAVANKLDGRTLKLRADSQIKQINKELAQLARQKAEYKINFSKAYSELQRFKAKYDKITADMARVQGLQTGSFAPLSKWQKSLDNVSRKYLYTSMNGAVYSFKKGAKEITKDGGKAVRTVTNVTDAFRTQSETIKHSTGVGLKAVDKTYKKYVESARSALPKMKEMASQYAGQMKKLAKTANWTDYYKTMGWFDRASSSYNADKKILQGLSKEGAERLKAENDAIKAQAQAEKDAMKARDLAYKRGLFAHVPQTIRQFGDLQRTINGLGRTEALETINNQMDLLRGKLNSVSIARAKFAAEDTAEAKAKQQYLGVLGRQYQGEYKWLANRRSEINEYNRSLDAMETKIAHAGARMQTLGATLQRISSPFVNVFRGLTMGIGYRMLGKVTQSISGAFERYDTMRTYAKVLNEMGINANKKFVVGTGKAMDAVHNLEKSVLGLPTGLDEMVAAMRRYAGATGEIESATKLAIAANNTYIAGQMEERAKLFTERQLKALAGGAELATTQWDSLQRNAPLAIRAVADEMDMSVKDMIADLKSGKIAGQEFLDVFVSVGTQGKIANAAQKMKMTWGAVSQNINNAMNRMGEGILKSIDDVYKKTTGRDFLQTVLGVDKNGKAVGGGIKNFIDGISESIQNFIRSNPERIKKFFDDLMSVNWGGLLQGYAEVASMFSKVAVGAAKGFDSLFGMKNLAKAAVFTNIVGKVIATIGGFTKGTAGTTAKMLMGGFFSGLIGKVKGFFKALVGIGSASKAATAAKTWAKWSKTASIAGTAVTKAATTWQDVASKAVSFAGILAIAQGFKIFSEALTVLDGVKFSPDLVANVGMIGTVTGTLVKAMSAIGSTIASSKLAIIGTGVATGAFMGITKGFDWFAGAIKKIAESMSMVSSLDLQTVRAKLPEFVSLGREMSDVFTGDDPFKSLGKMIDSWSKGSQAGALKKIAEAFKSIEDLSKVKIGKSAIKRAKRNFGTINDFMDALIPVFEIAERNTEGKVSGKKSVTKGTSGGVKAYDTLRKQTENYAEMVENLSTSFENMRTLVVNMKKLQNKFSDLTSRNKKQSQLDFSVVQNTVTDIATALFRLTSRPEGAQYSPLTMLKKASEQLSGANIGDMANAFKNIPSLMTEMQTVYNAIVNSPMFGEVSPKKPTTLGAFGFETPEIEKSPLATLEDTLTQMFGAIARIKASMPEDAGTFLEDTGYITQAIDGVRQIILKVQSLSTKGANTAGTIDISGLDIIAEKISTFITKVGNAMSQFGGGGGTAGLALNAGGLLAAVDSIRTAISKLSNFNFDNIQLNQIDGVVDRVKQALNKIRALDGQSVAITLTVSATVIETASAAIETAASNIKTAWNKIKPVYNKKVNIDIQTGNVVNTVPAAIKAAGNAITRAANAIPSSINKTVTVNIRPGGTNDPLGLLNSHTGGYIPKKGTTPIYRALGGFAIMRPKGTDTVPAMLTPGEYVMRRKAVDTFGARFFQQLNHLDVNGALRALSVRAGQAITPKSGTVINNKTTNNDNHAKVTINNNSPAASVGLGMASRYVGALR